MAAPSVDAALRDLAAPAPPTAAAAALALGDALTRGQSSSAHDDGGALAASVARLADAHAGARSERARAAAEAALAAVARRREASIPPAAAAAVGRALFVAAGSTDARRAAGAVRLVGALSPLLVANLEARARLLSALASSDVGTAVAAAAAAGELAPIAPGFAPAAARAATALLASPATPPATAVATARLLGFCGTTPSDASDALACVRSALKGATTAGAPAAATAAALAVSAARLGVALPSEALDVLAAAAAVEPAAALAGAAALAPRAAAVGAPRAVTAAVLVSAAVAALEADATATRWAGARLLAAAERWGWAHSPAAVDAAAAASRALDTPTSLAGAAACLAWATPDCEVTAAVAGGRLAALLARGPRGLGARARASRHVLSSQPCLKPRPPPSPPGWRLTRLL